MPGEQGYLRVFLRGVDPEFRPPPPVVQGTSIQFYKSETQINPRGEVNTVFVYRVTPAKLGQFTIPSITLRAKGFSYNTPTLTYDVHPVKSLTPLPSGIRNHKILVGWFPEKTTLYVGEHCPVTLKIYVPKRLPIAKRGWGLPDPAKHNCLAWRFSFPFTLPYLLPDEDEAIFSSSVTIQGITYRTGSYHTTLSGIQPGKAVFGPVDLRLIVRQSLIDPMKGAKMVESEITLNIPSLSFKILPLPKGAPDGFKGAVGHFSISALCTKTSFNESEPTEVILRVIGHGSHVTVQPPHFDLKNNPWKIIDTSKINRGEERRFIEGAVAFRQLLRVHRTKSQKLPTQIPSYSLSYFDPVLQSYQTIHTLPIPVHITPAPEKTSKQSANATSDYHAHLPEEKWNTRPEEMRQIIGFISHPQLPPTSPSTTSQIIDSLRKKHLWYVFPGLIALFILSVPIRKKIKAITLRHPDTRAQQSMLKSLAKTSDTIEFYRLAGRFIEQWIFPTPTSKHTSPTHPNDEKQLKKILKMRDSICFQASTSSPQPLQKQEKQKILTLLKRCSHQRNKLNSSNRSNTSTIALIALSFLFSTSLSPQLQAENATQTTPPSLTLTQKTPDTRNELLSKAHNAWRAKNYTEAIRLFQEAYPDPTVAPADILYNLGNCYHRLNQIGPATLAWRRALLADPTHIQARQNLRFTEIQHQSLVPHYKDWQYLLTRFSPTTYQLIFEISLSIFALSLLAFLILHPKGKFSVILIVLLVFSPVMASLGKLAVHEFPDDHLFAPLPQQSIALSDTLMHAGPHHLDEKPVKIPAGSLLRIEASRGTWTKVNTTKAQSGWILTKDLAPVIP